MTIEQLHTALGDKDRKFSKSEILDFIKELKKDCFSKTIDFEKMSLYKQGFYTGQNEALQAMFDLLERLESRCFGTLQNVISAFNQLNAYIDFSVENNTTVKFCDTLSKFIDKGWEYRIFKSCQVVYLHVSEKIIDYKVCKLVCVKVSCKAEE